MKETVEKAGIQKHYMVQPIAYRTADATKMGFTDFPGCPLGKQFFLIWKYFSLYFVVIFHSILH